MAQPNDPPESASVSYQSGDSSARRRVSQACVPCARRKTKCDGGLPTCGQCLQRDIQECTYSTSRRNKRTRKSSPSLSYQQRSSIGVEDRSALYSRPLSSVNPVKQVERTPDPRQEILHTPRSNFAALDALATSASARAQPTPILPKISNIPAEYTLDISRDASTQLFKAYFSTIHPLWPILYKPMYDRDGWEHLPDTMPRPLLYAIYSIAACVQPQHEFGDRAFDSPSPAHIFRAALSSLNRSEDGYMVDAMQSPNLLRPSIETCQALALLALQQHGVGEFSRAALLCSLAAAMAIELRLHRTVNPIPDLMEAQIRSRLWWNIYVLDKMISCEMGKPVILRWEECDQPLPSSSEADEYQLLSLRSSIQNRVSSVKTHTISGFHTTIKCVIIMEKIAREIYSVAGKNAIREGSPLAEEARLRLWQDLQDYHKMLDESPLRLDTTCVSAPVTITNMVWMGCCTVLLHRPFIPYWRSQRTLEERDSEHWKDPLEVCVVASNSICDILEGYAENLPLLSCDMIFPIFTTASTLSYHLQNSESKDPDIRRRIDLCIRWLLILSKSWKNAGARHEQLARDFKTHSTSSTDYLNDQDSKSSSSHLAAYASTGPISDIAATGMNGDFHHPSSSDDWAFLNNYGDASDDFYTIDTNFRDMMQHANSVPQGPYTA